MKVDASTGGEKCNFCMKTKSLYPAIHILQITNMHNGYTVLTSPSESLDSPLLLLLEEDDERDLVCPTGLRKQQHMFQKNKEIIGSI